jgi:hypothetical protein
MNKMENGYGRWACVLLVLGLSGCADVVRALLEQAGRDEAAAATPDDDDSDPHVALLPKEPAYCPEISSGKHSFKGIDVQLWVGDEAPEEGRPVLIYWHGTGSSFTEAESLLPGTFGDILRNGGIIAALTETTGQGEGIATAQWYTGDFDVVDELVGCLGAHGDIDPQRIYTAGCDAGGIHAAALANVRSNYIAGSMLSSGGQVLPFALQDPKRVPVTIAAHGEPGYDVVIVDFSETSRAYADDLVSQGGFAVLCNHEGNHCGANRKLVAAQWEFLEAHPYGVEPEPYADGLPDSFPEYCQIVE